jgi:uncharacterized protein YegJ (DUF2314 family)
MGLWSWLRVIVGTKASERPQRRDKPLVALVLFLNQPRLLDAAELAERAGDVFGEPFTCDNDNATDNFVAGAEPSFIFKHGDHFYLINSFERPYVEDPEAAADSIVELRLRKAVREHCAWLSVDLLGECSQHEVGEVYRTIGKLLAELADDDCVAIFAPATGQISVFDEEARDRLRSSDPLEAFETSSHPPVVPVSGDDPRLRAAVAKARRRWPDFVTRFEQRQPEQTFSVKAKIGNEETAEFMWVSVTGLENGWIYGRLDNDPIELTSIRCGDRVRVKVSDLNDWLFTDGNKMIGGFTIDVLRKIQEGFRNN